MIQRSRRGYFWNSGGNSPLLLLNGYSSTEYTSVPPAKSGTWINLLDTKGFHPLAPSCFGGFGCEWRTEPDPESVVLWLLRKTQLNLLPFWGRSNVYALRKREPTSKDTDYAAELKSFSTLSTCGVPPREKSKESKRKEKVY